MSGKNSLNEDAASRVAGANADWDDSTAVSSRCDVASARRSGAEIDISFGARSASGDSLPEIQVDLKHRIVLDVTATRQLRQLMQSLLAAHASRYGGYR